MNIFVRDVEVLAQLKPEYVRGYLKSKGWSVVGQYPDGVAEVWEGTGADGRSCRATVLTDRELGDYIERTYELLEVLARCENRSQFAVFEDIERVPWDAVAVQSEHPAATDGSIPWREGMRLHESVQEMLLSGALSTMQTRPIHASARPKPVTEYASGIRMGQSSRGSYIVNALSPLRIPSDPPAQASLFPSEPAPSGFGRRALSMLFGALTATQRAARFAREVKSTDAFVEAVQQGVSANLLESITDATGGGEARVRVAVRWSPFEPAPPGPRVVTFERDEIELIDAAGRHFRAHYPEDDVVLEGFVVRIDRTSERFGDAIALDALVRGRIRRVGLEVVGDDYKHAIEALEQRRRICFRGTLIHKGRGYVLLNPTEVRDPSPGEIDDPESAVDDPRSAAEAIPPAPESKRAKGAEKAAR